MLWKTTINGKTWTSDLFIESSYVSECFWWDLNTRPLHKEKWVTPDELEFIGGKTNYDTYSQIYQKLKYRIIHINKINCWFDALHVIYYYYDIVATTFTFGLIAGYHFVVYLLLYLDVWVLTWF